MTLRPAQLDGAYLHIRATATFICQEFVLRCQARQLLEERVRGAGLQRGLAKVLHTAERERAAARAAATRELCAYPRLTPSLHPEGFQPSIAHVVGLSELLCRKMQKVPNL